MANGREYMVTPSSDFPLHGGDVVQGEIENIGILTSPVIAEPLP